MVRISNEQEFLECFRELDREEIELPADLRFPFVVRDYLAWTEPSGFRVFLLVSDKAKRQALGLVFRRDQSGSDHARMCDWCHCMGSGNEITLLTAASSRKKRVGMNLCRDLSCKDKANADPEPDNGPLALTGYARVQRITDRMLEFARRNCF